MFSPKFGHSIGTTGSGNVPNNIYDGARITVVSGRIGRVKWSEPWVHDNHEDMDCECQTSDWMEAYIHDLTVNKREPTDSPDADMASNIRPESDWNKSPPGLVPFVSCRPGAYGRLLLAVYERRLTGLLVSSDWLRPVTRGGWCTGFPDRGRGSADVS